jgi:hypothetical protein
MATVVCKVETRQQQQCKEHPTMATVVCVALAANEVSALGAQMLYKRDESVYECYKSSMKASYIDKHYHSTNPNPNCRARDHY